ncbi:MAG: tetratricopeptide repeat protein [Candidatus Omnitrophica bacterium]|nr:tetratricopeptide repeat protein [Candidatus Omnitrophota bacterium]
MCSGKREWKNIVFHGQPPIPTSSALRGYNYKQPLCACGVAGLIKTIFSHSLLAIVIAFPSIVWASVAGEVNQANDLYKQGKFDDSLKLYQKALDQDDKSSVIKYDFGTTLYKKGDYSKALGYLEQAAQDKNIGIRPKAEYNLGNVLYKSGIKKENTNVDEAIRSLQEALGHYRESIADNPKDQDALFNQDFVKKEIERLKKKKQQQQKQQRQNQKQQRQDQKNNQKNQNAKQQQGQKKQEPRDQKEEGQKELDRKEAQDLLEEYKENEEPKKLLNYMPKKIDDRPVLRDW